MKLLTAEQLRQERLGYLDPSRQLTQARQDIEQGRVGLQQIQPTSAIASYSDESRRRSWTIQFQQYNNNVSISCTCGQTYQHRLCRHALAAALLLRDYLSANPPVLWKTILDSLPTIREPQKPTIMQGELLFSLQSAGYAQSWTVIPYVVPSGSLPYDLLDNPTAFGRAVVQAKLGSQAVMLKGPLLAEHFPQASEAELIAARLTQTKSNMHQSYSQIYQSTELSVAALGLLAGRVIFQGNMHTPFLNPLRITNQPGYFESQMAQGTQSIVIQSILHVEGTSIPINKSNVIQLYQNPLIVRVHDMIVPIEGQGLPSIIMENPVIEIPSEHHEQFRLNYLPKLPDQLPLRHLGYWTEVDTPPQPRLYLSEEAQTLIAELRFGYAQFEIPANTNGIWFNATDPSTQELYRIKRYPDQEAQWVQQVNQTGFKRGNQYGHFNLRAGVTPVDFLLRYVPKLLHAGVQVFGEEQITKTRVNRHRPVINFEVSSGIDWFDLKATVQYGDTYLPLHELRQAIRRQERYVQLGDGTIGILPEELVAQYRKLTTFSHEQPDSETMRFHQQQITLLDQLLGEQSEQQHDAMFRKRLEQVHSFDKITPQALPASFRGELRPYQKSGYDWLHFLHQYQFGGILADDMGTGKTIQTLVFLQSLYQADPTRSASLIVMPRSLLFNWKREAERFVPELQVYIHADKDRLTDTNAFHHYQLVLTTYGTMLRDIQLLKQYLFYYAILDESQAIKNPIAETSRAARSLQSQHRLVLTGTPIENSTTELWSQFAFTNPGLLGNLERFREEFVNPIEKSRDQTTADMLRRTVYPFILRRTKSQVAADLPARSERVVICDMEPAQRKLYDKTKTIYRSKLLGMIDAEGIDSSRMLILEGLLRLRQICNHPRLVDAAFKGTSGKLELLLETLTTLRTEGHRALIFSQFVQMLEIVRQNLDQQKVPYAYLDGQTRDRQKVVDQFQQHADVPFFLISLKAGGVGLNLTAADYVIHIDPWWNPAVEMQATDRTHRIGQDKPVFVYRLVTRDSVEEKILQLQENKRVLVDQLISTDSSVFKSLTRDDLETLLR